MKRVNESVKPVYIGTDRDGRLMHVTDAEPVTMYHEVFMTSRGGKVLVHLSLKGEELLYLTTKNNGMSKLKYQEDITVPQILWCTDKDFDKSAFVHSFTRECTRKEQFYILQRQQGVVASSIDRLKARFK